MSYFKTSLPKWMGVYTLCDHVVTRTYWFGKHSSIGIFSFGLLLSLTTHGLVDSKILFDTPSSAWLKGGPRIGRRMDSGCILTLNIFINNPPLTIMVLFCLFMSCLCLNDAMIVYKYRSGGRWGALLFSNFWPSLLSLKPTHIPFERLIDSIW